MTLPAFLFGSLVSWLLASVFHLVVSGNIKRIILYILFSWIGFWAGNYLGIYFGINLLKWGLVDYGMAVIGSFILLVFAYWLSSEISYRK